MRFVFSVLMLLLLVQSTFGAHAAESSKAKAKKLQAQTKKLQLLFYKRLDEEMDLSKPLDQSENMRIIGAPGQAKSLIGAKYIRFKGVSVERFSPQIREHFEKTGLKVHSEREPYPESESYEDGLEVQIDIDPLLAIAMEVKKEYPDSKTYAHLLSHATLSVYQNCSVSRIPGSSVRAMTYQLFAMVTVDNAEDKMYELINTFVIDLLRVNKPD